MSVRINSYIEGLGVSLTELNRMSETEREALVEKKISELPKSKQKKAFDEIRNQLAQIETKIEDKQDNLRAMRRGADKEEKAEIKRLIDSLDELADNIGDIGKDFQDAMAEILDHTRDFSSGSNVDISDLDLDGKEYTFNLGGGAGANPLAGLTNSANTSTALPQALADLNLSQEEVKYLQDKKIINDKGEVIANKDNVEGFNYGDIEAALKEMRKDVVTKQIVFIKTDGAAHWRLQQHDPITGTYTFIVEDADGNQSPVTFKNASNVMFQFTSGITASDMAAIKRWPESLLKNSSWGDPGVNGTFYDVLFPKEEGANFNRLKAIKGYNDARGSIKTFNYSPMTDGQLSPELETKVEESLDKLFAIIDKPADNKAADVWNTLLTKDFAGLSKADKDKVIQHIILALAKTDMGLLDTLLSNSLKKIENSLKGDGTKDQFTMASRALIIFIEESTELPGNFESLPGGLLNPQGDLMKGLGEAEINQIKSIYETIGDTIGLETGSNFDAVIATLPKADLGANSEGKGAKTQFDEMKEAGKTYEHGSDSVSVWDDEDWPNFLDSLQTKIFDENGNLLAGEALWQAVYDSAVEAMEGDENDWGMDDILCNLMLYIDEKFSSEFKTAFFSSISTHFLKWIDEDGGSEATNEYQAKAILGAYKNLGGKKPSELNEVQRTFFAVMSASAMDTTAASNWTVSAGDWGDFIDGLDGLVTAEGKVASNAWEIIKGATEGWTDWDDIVAVFVKIVHEKFENTEFGQTLLKQIAKDTLDMLNANWADVANEKELRDILIQKYLPVGTDSSTYTAEDEDTITNNFVQGASEFVGAIGEGAGAIGDAISDGIDWLFG